MQIFLIKHTETLISVFIILTTFIFITTLCYRIIVSFNRFSSMLQCRKDILSSLGNGNDTYDDLLSILEVSEVNKKDAILILKIILKDTNTGKIDLKNRKHIIKKFIEQLIEEEPFKEIPEDIKKHFKNLQETLKKEQMILIEPIIHHVTDLIKFNDKENRKQKFYTKSSFIFAVISFVALIFSYLTNGIN